MACEFSIPVSGTPEDMLSKARKAVESQGGRFQGDSNSGSFSVNVMGSIEGEYTVSNNQLMIRISNKPMFIPCATIESFLKNKMGS